MAFEITATGLSVQTQQEIKTELEAAFRSTFNPSLNVSPNSIAGRLIAVFSEREAILQELVELLYNNFDPDASTGTILEALCALTGTLREAAAGSTVTLSLTGTTGILIPSGTEASEDTTGDKFATDADATLAAATAWAPATAYVVGDRVTNSGNIYDCTTAGTSAGSGGPSGTGTGETDNTVVWQYVGSGTGYADAAATATETGPTSAVARSITTIETPVSGLNSVINLLDATEGTDLESDEDLRVRREVELAAPGSTPEDALRADLLAVANVTNVSLFGNKTNVTDSDGVPAHAVEALVQGGTDQDIWDALLASVAAGIQTYGTETGTATTSEGKIESMAFSRPTTKDIYVDITLTYDADDYPATGDDAIKSKIVERGDEAVTGLDVVSSRIKAWCFEIDGVLDVSLAYIGLSASPVSEATLAISSRELALFDTSRITVSSSSATP